MTPDKFKKVEEIYHEALELAPTARSKMLDLRCDGDLELRKEVDSLLSIGTREGFIDSSPEDVAAALISEKEKVTLVGSQIGRYSVLSIIGEGGMGEVYLARDEELKRKVALKVLPAEMVENADRLQRFIHEARSASALSHPNILTIYEVGKSKVGDETVHYISMEYIEGEVFNSFIYKRRVPFDRLFEYLCQTAEGISKAHLAGIVHRDLKPENIMVNSDGFAKVLDFGLAKLVDKDVELNDFQKHKSKSGVILGTVGYMSPEQAKGSAEIDQRSDIFSFGCILYETITQNKPFVADSAVDTLHKIIHEAPKSIEEQNDSVPGSLIGIVGRCLEKNPADRFQTIREVIDSLKAIKLPENRSLSPESSGEKTGTLSIREAAPTRTISQPAFDHRKQVTFLYADIAAITELFEVLDPEEASDYLEKFWLEVEQTILDSGGAINERLSDGFTAVWGSEMTREDDPERAIRTALSVQKQVSKYIDKNHSGEFDLKGFEEGTEKENAPLKIGIDTGLSLIRKDVSSETPTISGAGFSVAKRLVTNESGLGKVIVSHSTYRHIRGVFDVTPRDISHELKLKNEFRNTKAYEINRLKPRAFRLETRGVGGVETKLIGRQGEMDKLLDALYSVFEEKELRAVTIIGEAGLGKSRLLYEFRDQLELIPEKVLVFNARAYEGLNNLPFSLIRDLFSFRFEISDDDVETVAKTKLETGIEKMLSTSEQFSNSEVEQAAHFIGSLIGFDYSNSPHFKGIADEPEQLRERAIAYAQRFFQAVCQSMSTVIILDDLHWADHDSLIFFERLIAKLTGSQILLLGFARPSLLERRTHWAEGIENHSRFDLTLLSKRELRMLVNDVLRHVDKPSKELIKLVVDNADGNPFYAEELIKMMIDRKIISTDLDTWAVNESRLVDFQVPGSLSGVLQARFDQLSSIEKSTLQYASVIGFEFWAEALEELEDEKIRETILKSLRAKEIIYRHENSVFKNASEYVFKHALFRDVVYETILLRNRKQLHQNVATWLVKKSVNLKNDNAPMIAEHFENAELYSQASEWFGNAGDFARKTNSPEAAKQYFSNALKLSEKQKESERNIPKELEWRKRLGNALHRLAKFDEAIEEFGHLLKEAGKIGDANYQAEACLGLSFANLENGDNRKALETAIRISEIIPSEEKDIEREILKAKGLYRKARALYSLGEYAEVVKLGKKVLDQSKNFDRRGAKVLANSYHILAAANMTLGRFDEAFDFESREIELSRSIDDTKTVANGLNSLGEQMRLRGEPEKAIDYYQQALEVTRKISAKNSEVMISSNLGGAKILLGEFSDAENTLRKVFELVGDREHFILPETHRFLAEALYGQGKFEEALKTGKESLKLSEAAENNENIACAWRAIANILAATKESATINGINYTAEDCFDNAIDIFEKSGMKAEYARTLRDFASTADDPKASEMLTNASTIFEDLKMKADLRKTQKAIVALD